MNPGEHPSMSDREPRGDHPDGDALDAVHDDGRLATGFDSENDEKVIPGNFRRARPHTPAPMQVEPVQPAQMAQSMVQPILEPPPHQLPMEQADIRMAMGGGSSEPILPLNRFPERMVSREQIEGLDIPTFIRRQMD